MAETNHKEVEEGGENAGAVGNNGPMGVVTREKKEAQQKKKRCLVRSVDEMKITELKDALSKLNLSTTGNKAVLQMRLRGARARRQASQEAEDEEGSDDAAGNESVASDSMTESDEASSDEEATSKKEDRRRKRKDRDRTVKRNGASKVASEKQRRRMKKEKKSRSDQNETDDESESESSDDDSSRGRSHDSRRCRRNHFTIKDVEGSLTHFSDDDKLPIEKWIDEYEDMSVKMR